MQRSQGFTLIEIMIVVAVISILIALALPTYQDFLIRSRVTEGLQLVNPAQKAVSGAVTTAADLKSVATTWNALAGGSGAKSKYVTSVQVDDASGVVTVTFDNATVGSIPANATVIYSPYVQTGAAAPISLAAALAAGTTGNIDWSCSSATNITSSARNMVSVMGTLPAMYVPTECR